jgi:hypothetical protein
MRRYLVYSYAGRFSSDPLQQVCQPDQVFVAKEGSSCGNLNEWIDPSDIRAARQNRPQPASIIVEVHAILTPVVAVFQQLKFASEQRMEGMGYTEMFLWTTLLRCN